MGKLNFVQFHLNFELQKTTLNLDTELQNCFVQFISTSSNKSQKKSGKNFVFVCLS